jgi:tetratricopeptide (TPR) repeat protein
VDQVRWDGGEVIGLYRGEPRWRLRLTPEISDARVHDIVLDEDQAYVCALGCLYWVDLDEGHVRRRQVLPGHCHQLARRQGVIEVTVGGSNDGHDWRATYLVGSDRVEVPYFLPADPPHALGRYRQAVVTLNPKAHPPRPDLSAEQRQLLEESLPALEGWATADGTNPWFHTLRGRYLTMLGRDDEARRAYERALKLDRAYDDELIAMASLLDPVAPDLADEAFERGMAFLLAHGYQPELAFGLVTMVVQLGPPNRGPATLDMERDREVLLRFAHRLEDFAPFTEGTSGFYATLAESAVNEEGDEADHWLALAQQAQLTRHFAPLDPQAPAPGAWLNLLLALLATFVIVVVFKTLRTWPTSVATSEGWRRWVPFRWWHWDERLGLVLLALPLLLAGVQAAQGFAIWAMLAGAPAELGAGSLGHPALAHLTDDMVGNSGSDLVRAIALHQRGELDQAQDLYRTVAHLPQGQINLGVLLHQRGFRQRAAAHFRRALELDPQSAEAAHNLGLPAQGRRVERARRYGFEGPLLALPRPEQWQSAWRRVVQRQVDVLAHPLAATSSVFVLHDGASGVQARPLTGAATLLWILALVSLTFPPRPVVPRNMMNRLAAALGFLVPGVSRHYSLAGPLFLGLFLLQIWGAVVLTYSGGASGDMIDLLSTPAYEQYFSLTRLASTDASGRAFYEAWWITLTAHVIFTVAMTIIARGKEGQTDSRDRPL